MGVPARSCVCGVVTDASGLPVEELVGAQPAQHTIEIQRTVMKAFMDLLHMVKLVEKMPLQRKSLKNLSS